MGLQRPTSVPGRGPNGIREVRRGFGLRTGTWAGGAGRHLLEGLSPPMRVPPTGILSLAVMLASLVAVVPHAGATTPAPLRFGMDAAASSVQAQVAAGVKPDYGVLWIGPWTTSSGWGGPDDTMARLKAAGVTPAIHFYYWGDDISPPCVESG